MANWELEELHSYTNTNKAFCTTTKEKGEWLDPPSFMEVMARFKKYFNERMASIDNLVKLARGAAEKPVKSQKAGKAGRKK